MKTIQRLPVRQPVVTDFPRLEVPCVLPAGVTAHGAVGRGGEFIIALHDGTNTATFDADGLSQIEISIACKDALRVLAEAAPNADAAEAPRVHPMLRQAPVVSA